MIAIFLLMLCNFLVSKEELILVAPSPSEIECIQYSFKRSHQLSDYAGIDEILDPYVSDACTFIPTMNYLTRNPSRTISLQAAIFTYYIEYQHHLLQPVRNPDSVAYRLKSWKNSRKAEKNLRAKIKNHSKQISPNKSVNEECDINVAMIQKITKELVLIEKANKKRDH